MTAKTKLEGFIVVGPLEPINLTPEQASWPVKVSESPEQFILVPETSPIAAEPDPAAGVLARSDRRILVARLDGRSVEAIATELNLPSEAVARRVAWLRDHFTASPSG